MLLSEALRCRSRSAARSPAVADRTRATTPVASRTERGVNAGPAGAVVGWTAVVPASARPLPWVGDIAAPVEAPVVGFLRVCERRGPRQVRRSGTGVT